MSIISEMVDKAIKVIKEKMDATGQELDSYQKSADLRKKQLLSLRSEMADLVDYKNMIDAKAFAANETVKLSKIKAEADAKAELEIKVFDDAIEPQIKG